MNRYIPKYQRLNNITENPIGYTPTPLTKEQRIAQLQSEIDVLETERKVIMQSSDRDIMGRNREDGSNSNAFGVFLLIVAIVVALFNLLGGALIAIFAIACFMIGNSNRNNWNSKAQAARQSALVEIDRQIAAKQRQQDMLLYLGKEQV